MASIDPVLGSIFSYFTLHEKICMVNLVCKSWKRVVADWNSLDLMSLFQAQADDNFEHEENDKITLQDALSDSTLPIDRLGHYRLNRILSMRVSLPI